jgi:hypothetical protein
MTNGHPFQIYLSLNPKAHHGLLGERNQRMAIFGENVERLSEMKLNVTLNLNPVKLKVFVNEIETQGQFKRMVFVI